MTNLRRLRRKTDLDTADDAWHTLQTVPPELATMPDSATKALILFQQVDDEDVRLADNATTADVTVIPYATGRAPDAEDVTAVLGGAETREGHSLVNPITIELPPGWSFAVHLSIITSPHDDAAALDVWWQPYRP